MTQTWTDAAVRRLSTDEDREACMDLAEDREWGREEPKWRMLFEAAEVYGVDAPDGGLAGCYTLTRYGAEAAAIGMVLVASRFNGRGLGRRMMTHALSVAGDGVVSLHATEMGRPLYEKLGFEVVDANSSHYGHYTGEPKPPASRPVDDVAEILAYDREASGLDRGGLLTVLFGHAADFRVIDDADGRVRGYAAAWRNTHQLVIGPVVADDLDTAAALITDIASRTDAEVRIDVLHSRPQLRAWAIGVGIAPRFDGTYMSLDGRAVPGDAGRVWAPVTQAV